MKDFFKHSGGLALLAAGLLAAIALVVALTVGGTGPITNFFGFVTTPIRDGVSAVGDWVEGFYSRAYEVDRLQAEVERLQKELSDMSQKAREGEAASRENENFRELLNLQKKRADFVFESATVTARGTSNWASTFTISKGTSSDVAKNHCVIDAYGNLAGVVTEVGLNWATVSTLIDTGTEMGGLVGRTDSAAILEGDFALMGEGQLKLTYLPENTKLIAGDVVLTSGKGGIYPSGLVAGEVLSVHTDASGMNRYAVVAPTADLGGLKQVFVIKSFDIVE